MASTQQPVIVLLVQPERDDRDMYVEFLRHSGFVPVPVSSAAEALSIAAGADVIVTGLLLPGDMDGVAFIRRLRDDERTKRIPIIVLTACAWESDRLRAAAASDAFLVKPCLPDRLVAEIHRTLALLGVPRAHPAHAEVPPSARFRRSS